LGRFFVKNSHQLLRISKNCCNFATQSVNYFKFNTMKRLIIPLLFVCWAATSFATTLRVEQIQSSDFTIMVQTIGKLVINGTTLKFYDRQGTLIHSADMETIGAIFFEESSTAIDNVFTSDRYMVYPNPTASTLIVKGLDSSATLRLYSTSGQLVKSVVGNTMDVENISAGTYLLQCENQIVKIIKQ